MRKSLSILIFFLCLCGTGTGQVVYVNASAMAGGDGSSWATAYNTLDAALENSTDAEIWIAAGTYIPGGGAGDTSSTYLINSAVSLYGGFSGTESDRSQRNPEQYPVILSGDILQDDDGMMTPSTRDDNTRHVVFIEGDIAEGVILDGLIIAGGQTSDDGDHEFTNRAGGGVYTESRVTVANCIFTDNFGRSGAGLCVNNTGTLDGMIEVRNTEFSDNVASSQSAGLVMYSVVDAMIDGCSFIENTTNRGTLYPVECQNVWVRDCHFENNVNPTGFGGAMFSWQTMNLTLEGCTFRSNQSVQSGCMYYDARNIVTLNPSLTIRNCLFQNNSATDGFSGAFTIWQGTNILIEDCEFNRNTANSAGCLLYNGTDTPNMNPDNLIIRNCEFGTNEALEFGGGACYFSGSSFTIDSSTFLGNIGANSGGALFCTGSNKNYLVANSFFGLNNSNYGGAMTNYGENTNGIIRDCEFLSNTAGTGGGAMNCGFKANILLDGCSFMGSTANVGGAVSAQNDSTTMTVRNCSFINNTANGSGGGFFTFTGDLAVHIDGSTFEDNSAEFGAGVHLAGDENIDTSFFTIDKCIFRNNISVTQGGAVNVINKSGLIQNSLFYENIAENIGTGGAISTNASNDVDIEITLMNSTLVNNLGLLSSGIAAWTDTTGTNTLRVQNTILDNGNDYEVEDGSPELISLGGNFTTDVFLELLLGAADIVGVGAGFVNASEGNFHLEAGSPCIDAGVAENAPEEDLDGHPRDAMPDIGAYEYNASTSLNEPALYEVIEVFPNPASEIIRIEVPSGKTGIMSIYDKSGRLMKKSAITSSHVQIDIGAWPAGEYFIFIIGTSPMRSSFIKL